jgi:Domain of unknown function (DUF4190)
MNEPSVWPPPPPPPPPPPSAPVSASASNQAITALVLGLLGITCCHIVAPVAWFLGHGELRAIRAGRAPAAGEGFALAGKILGIIGTVILIVAFVWVLFFGGMVVLQGLAHHR